MLSRLGVGLAVAVCIGVTPSAAYAQFTERLSLGLEGSASTHLLAPQSDQYGFGFQAGGRFALRVAGPVAIHLFGSYARWGASTPQIPAGVMSLFGGGLRLAPEVSRSVGRFVLDLDVGVSLSGSDNAAAGTARTTALSLGGGIGWLFPVASVLSLGPIVRVHYLKSLADVSAGDRDRSLFWTAGLSVTLHGPRAEEPRRARETDLVADVVRREREDTDHDGVLDADDRCPTQPETRNNHQDDDGCPDALPTGDDTDGDQIVNANDRCADQAEDFDGFQDEDGCPEPDNDNDGVPDTQDQCADQAETRNNFQDDDGCADEAPPGAGVTV